MEYYSAPKRSELLAPATAWMHVQRIMLWKKKPISKDYIPYDSIDVTFLKWQFHKWQSASWWEGLREGRVPKGRAEVIKGEREGSSQRRNCSVPWLGWRIHKPVQVINCTEHNTCTCEQSETRETWVGSVDHVYPYSGCDGIFCLCMMLPLSNTGQGMWGGLRIISCSCMRSYSYPNKISI